MGVEEAITVYIFCGGEFYSDCDFPYPKCDYAIAADSGMYVALQMGIVPDLFIGDFDSFDKRRLSDCSTKLVESIKTVQFPVKKDLTDSMIAVDIAVEKGADKIVIYGALGGRLDHTLSNVFLLRSLKHKGIEAVVDNGKNAVRYIEDESITLPRRYKYISLLAYGSKAVGVDIQGVEYPLENAELDADFPYAVSNGIIGENCYIGVKSGGILVVESNE